MSVNYEEAGNPTKKTIIFVHGAGGSSATWFMQLRGLSSDYHIVAVDLNGHGKSPDRAEEDVLHSYLHDVHELVTKFDKPFLAGHSMGGALAQLYALNHPEYLKGIILVGTGARLRVTPMVFNLLDNDFDGYVEAVGNFMFHEETSEEMIEASKHEVRKCPPQIIHRDFELCDKFDIMDKVSQIKSPTLIIVGDADAMTPTKYSTYLKDKIEDSVLHVIEQAGHSVMLEKFGVFNELIANWVNAIN
ncbi:MAG: 4,5:9,10-diseco-3-hydroxy-5,9,17-trioxoandrosta-1(10),2-diene-4-oate hydrolase [Candidatus Thorarchaeota archaeon AB_25]|nr:MAG: 4,5:9,10-diseco-3-hydroxy-5,9,17-trioxoandrosta-1(10),2-diene-4-oate hydrolase [Candidatus Thorarchaeota archaeon AB_25]